jgi:radical SAM protein (TIGR01212 family)
MWYNSFNAAMGARFGCKVYKLALSGGMTCPNRDGTLGTRGCIFCSEQGSGEFATVGSGEIATQIEAAKRLVASKIRNGKYIAYFQNFTNTYGPVAGLEQMFKAAITHSDVVALSIATRPDCLPPPVLALLARLRRIKPVWVELGLQTIHKQTAQYIRRGYDLSCYEQAVKDLKAIGVEVVTHIIIGLPGETGGMAAETAAYVGESGADGIKMHLLYVVRGTDLARDYEAGRFQTLELETYIGILEECIRRLPPEIVIHRLTGDGAKADLIAPLWSADKKRVLNAIRAAFERDNVVQGERCEVKNAEV